MFERLNYLHKANELTEKQLDIAVSKGWITEDQKAEIIGWYYAKSFYLIYFNGKINQVIILLPNLGGFHGQKILF